MEEQISRIAAQVADRLFVEVEASGRQEVLEFIVKPNSPATKGKIKDLDFPHDAIIGGIVRGDKTFIAVGNMEINAYDRVVVFSLPSAISRIGKFFN